MADNTRHLTFDEVAAIVQTRAIPEPNTGCMLWEGTTNKAPGKPRSYGQVRLGGKMVLAHHVAFRAAHGPIPEGHHIMHRCDQTLCVNPDHLTSGTNDENHADKARKDRGRKKLTAAQVMDIRGRAATGSKLSSLARAFEINYSTVHRIISGARRMHLPLRPE
jgi:hypothetical protein